MVYYDNSWADNSYFYEPEPDPAPAPASTPQTQATQAPAPEPEPAPAPEPEPEPEPEAPAERVVVSEERYDDCDGSGHGVKIITYSDGTQEEIEY